MSVSAKDLAFVLGTNAVQSTTIQELFTAITKEQLFNRLISSFNASGFPADDWNSGAGYRSITEAQASALSDFAAPESGNAARLQTIAASGFVDYAKGLWLKVLAYQVYRILFNPSTRTTGMVTLTCAAGAGPVTITNRQLRMQAASGNIYVGPTEAGPLILPDGGTLQITVESEFQNDSLGNPSRNYVDGSGTVNTLVTTIPGVTCSNPAPDFTSVTQVIGSSTGSATPSRTIPANPITPTRVAILITGSGQVGAATWSMSLNGGAYIAQGTIPVTHDIAVTNIRITFANGPTNPSFVAGSSFTFQSPGTWVTAQGTDEETDINLATRCRARWPSLSAIPTGEVYALWARTASPEVTRALATVSTVIAGRVDVLIAGQAGALPQTTIDIVQAYINDRHPITDNPVVASAITLAIALGGSVLVDSSKVETAQAQAQLNIGNLIAGLGVGAVVRYNEVIEQLMAADGVVDLQSMTLNGGGANLTLTPSQVPIFTQVLATALAWIPV